MTFESPIPTIFVANSYHFLSPILTSFVANLVPSLIHTIFVAKNGLFCPHMRHVANSCNSCRQLGSMAKLYNFCGNLSHFFIFFPLLYRFSLTFCFFHRDALEWFQSCFLLMLNECKLKFRLARFGKNTHSKVAL